MAASIASTKCVAMHALINLVFYNGNTTNFKMHIESEHSLPKDHNSSRVRSSTSGVKPGTFETVIEHKQLTLPCLLGNTKSPKLGMERKQNIDQALMKLVVGKVLPPSLVENQYFTDFTKNLEPRYKPPSRKTLMQSAKKEDIEQQIRNEIKQCTGLSLTHDGWKSSATESYNTTTVHYIHNWELKSAVLNTVKMEGSHTSEKISESVLETKTKWQLPDCIATTDNAANEKKAFALLNMPRFGCYGHRINLVVKNSLTGSNEVSRILGKARRLVTLFHTSSSVNDKLIEKQKLLLIKGVGHKLIADVSTRWNSSLAMLERILEQLPALMAVATDESVSKSARTTLQNCLFTFDETLIAEKVVMLLEPFQKATEVVCAEKVPTINKVIPVVLKLQMGLKENTDDPAIFKSLKRKMAEQLEIRSEIEDLALLGCILSPFTKGFEFMPDQKTKAESLLRNYVLVEDPPPAVKVKQEKDVTSNELKPPLPSLPTLPEVPIEIPVVSLVELEKSTSVEAPLPKKFKSADTEDWLSDIVCIGETKMSREDVLDAELSRYFGSSLKEADAKCTVLEWWKRNEIFFPCIAAVARKILCVQASSVSIERVFSLAGEEVSKKRSRLTPDNVDTFIFLKKKSWKGFGNFENILVNYEA
ncbi:E3 SUMO-protein ligase ZBED1-like [Mercenaria mercenaria]|uniref:E3 SUMO-protein ligase ZBED1-like n=1 Tax=Mercenaria mercenaria TaxID=6596 RepID=UPI00234F5AAA|nr:E3 SUMO-protein ligase ZBED1-like [Mercenaria mercenaria]